MAKKVLVTGARGFIGRHVSGFYAKRGWDVSGIGHGAFPPDERKKYGIGGWLEADVTLESLKSGAGKPDVIIHCAGSGSVSFSIADPFMDYMRSVNTTLHVLEFVRLRSPGTRVVLPSSAAVYGAAEKMPVSLAAPLNPVSPYGAHKKIAEELCRSYGAHFGVAAAIVRLFSVYGAGLDKQLLWDSCKKISVNDVKFWGTGEETRDWLHVNDAAELLFFAGQNASSDCPVVNGGSGSGVTVKEILTEIFINFNRPDGPVFSGTGRPGDPTHYVAEITEAKNWGWSPRTTWREGVREYIEWFKKSA